MKEEQGQQLWNKTGAGGVFQAEGEDVNGPRVDKKQGTFKEWGGIQSDKGNVEKEYDMGQGN